MTRLICSLAQIRANSHMSKIIFLAPVAFLSAFPLAACGSPVSPASSPPAGAAATSGASSGIYTYSTAPADETATANSLDESTASYVNARYGTEYAATDMECSPTYYESAADKSFSLWSCNYFVNGNSTGIIKITGPHSWQIMPGSSGS